MMLFCLLACQPVAIRTLSVFERFMNVLNPATASQNTNDINFFITWIVKTGRFDIYFKQDANLYNGATVLMYVHRFGHKNAESWIQTDLGNWNGSFTINNPNAPAGSPNNVVVNKDNAWTIINNMVDNDGLTPRDYAQMSQTYLTSGELTATSNAPEFTIPNNAVALKAGQSVVVFDKSITLTNVLSKLSSQALVQTKSALTQFWLSPVYADGTFSELSLPAAQLAQLNATLQQDSIVSVSFSIAPNGAGCNGTMVVSLPVVNEEIFSYAFENITINYQNQTPKNKSVPSTAKLTGLNITYQTQSMKAGKGLAAGLNGFNIARN